MVLSVRAGQVIRFHVVVQAAERKSEDENHAIPLEVTCIGKDFFTIVKVYVVFLDEFARFQATEPKLFKQASFLGESVWL